jgi:hypothetical protein
LSFWAGENVIYVGGDKYSGLGMPEHTEAELRTEFIKRYKEGSGDTADIPNAETHFMFTQFRRAQAAP